MLGLYIFVKQLKFISMVDLVSRGRSSGNLFRWTGDSSFPIDSNLCMRITNFLTRFCLDVVVFLVFFRSMNETIETFKRCWRFSPMWFDSRLQSSPLGFQVDLDDVTVQENCKYLFYIFFLWSFSLAPIFCQWPRGSWRFRYDVSSFLFSYGHSNRHWCVQQSLLLVFLTAIFLSYRVEILVDVFVVISSQEIDSFHLTKGLSIDVISMTRLHFLFGDFLKSYYLISTCGMERRRRRVYHHHPNWTRRNVSAKDKKERNESQPASRGRTRPCV